MSGLCGVVHFDGTRVERAALRAMAAALAFRGPDGSGLHVETSAGLAHAELRTDPGAPAGPQPMSLDGQSWIVADARVDAQSELRRSLAANGREGVDTCGDAALILHAWHAWGEDCVRHLIGDFAFAIWDGARRRLFCARDHFGVKQFFFARTGNRLVFSNTLDSVRAHAGVPATLDDLALADFLLFGHGLDAGATGFEAIRRLPPAGWLVASEHEFRTGTYWEPSPDQSVRYRHAGDYAERLRELLQLAVDDRVRSDRVAVQMSGGLDSTTLAALARRSLSARGRPFDLRAHTIVYDQLLPDEERRFSTLAAGAIGLPVRHHSGDTNLLYERFDRYAGRFPAPFHGPDLIVGYDALRGAAAHARVMLTGYDGDALLSESPRPYWRELWRQRRLHTLMASVTRHAIRRRRMWPSRPAAGPAEAPEFPAWIRADLVERLGLRERWRRFHGAVPETRELRPRAHQAIDEIRRTTLLFDQYDPGVTGLALECRHPFLDLRVVEFCLSLPPEPCCIDKAVLREAAKGLLPDEIRLRPKTPMAGWAGERMLQQPGARWIDDFEPVPGLDRYVERRSIPPVWGAARPLAAWRDLRPLTLNHWLPSQQRSCIPLEEAHHEIA